MSLAAITAPGRRGLQRRRHGVLPSAVQRLASLHAAASNWPASRLWRSTSAGNSSVVSSPS
ncbi:MAG: hypothetical protein ABIR94_22170, partial [Rubrivivax sp.]